MLKFGSVNCMVCVCSFLFLGFCLRFLSSVRGPPFSSGFLVHLGCSGSPQGRKHRHSFESTRSSPSMLKPTSSNRSLLGSSNTVSMFSTAVISGNIKLTDEEHESSEDGPIAGWLLSFIYHIINIFLSRFFFFSESVRWRARNKTFGNSS